MTKTPAPLVSLLKLGRVSLVKCSAPSWCRGDGSRELRGAMTQRTSRVQVDDFAPLYMHVTMGLVTR